MAVTAARRQARPRPPYAGKEPTERLAFCDHDSHVALAARRLPQAVGRSDSVRARLRRDPHRHAAGRAAGPRRGPGRWLGSWYRPASRFSSWGCSPVPGRIGFGAAYPAHVPSLIGIDRVVDGNSKLATSSSLAEIGGPSLAGALVQVVSAPFAILIDAVSFAFSAATLLLIEAPEPARPRQVADIPGTGYARLAAGPARDTIRSSWRISDPPTPGCSTKRILAS